MGKRKRIAIVVPTLSSAGGSVRIACWLAGCLAKNNDVALISCESFDVPAFHVEDNICLLSFDLPEVRVMQRRRIAKIRFEELDRKYNFDIVIAEGTYEALYSINFCRRKGVPLLFCDHGALINQWHDRKMTVIRALCAYFSTKTIVLTEANACDYERLLHVPKSKIVRMPNPVSPEFLGAFNGYDPDAKRIVWAGRLSPEKGVEFLLDIAQKALLRFPDWALDVYGDIDPSLDIDLPKELSERGIDEQVSLCGRASDMKSAYMGHSIGVLTSLREGFSLFLLEGRACGIPQISFDVNHGPRELIADGLNGYLVPCFDCEEYAGRLCKLMADRDLRKSMSLAARSGLEGYSPEFMSQKWKQLIDSVAS
ncbi:glycosyltransferase [Slackia piriformis]|uniref:glycosyltransferase n=1 Tax=Slackia piriformis TaxID=626934 RepID=UPI0026DD6B6E|nr:glycosyltransferase [Slackia piriformis]MDO5023700.1 glycosyltransferase [Slackia piriformis]